MGDYFRHKANGDALTVLFQYHHEGRADLRVKVLDTAVRLQGKGTLAQYDGFSLASINSPALTGSTLYIGGTTESTSDGWASFRYDSVEERNAALFAFCTMIDRVCGNTPGSSIPEFLGGAPKASYAGNCCDNAVEIKSNGGDSMFKTVKNTLSTNLLDAQLVVEVPGLGKDDVKVVLPPGKKQAMVLYKVDGKDQEPITYGLADAEVSGIIPVVSKGIFTLTVKYNLGVAITVTDGTVAAE